MKNDPYSPAQVFYSHTGSIYKDMYAIMVLDNKKMTQIMRVYDLNASETEIYAQMAVGEVQLVDSVVEDTQHIHNIADHVVAWTHWNNEPADYVLVFASDLFKDNSQTLHMEQFPQASTYHVILNMRGGIHDEYTLKLTAANDFSDLEINTVALTSVTHSRADEHSDVEIRVSSRAVVYEELRDFMDIDPMGGVITGEWTKSGKT